MQNLKTFFQAAIGHKNNSAKLNFILRKGCNYKIIEEILLKFNPSSNIKITRKYIYQYFIH